MNFIMNYDFFVAKILFFGEYNIIKNPKYTDNLDLIDNKDVYLFFNEEEYRNYFIKNGVSKEHLNKISLPGLRSSGGWILINKIACDSTIYYYKKMKMAEKKSKEKQEMVKHPIRSLIKNKLIKNK